jgi:hypothetical protein
MVLPPHSLMHFPCCYFKTVLGQVTSNHVTFNEEIHVPLWDLRPDIISCQNVAVWNVRFVSMGRHLWREAGSAICSVITQWSELLRTRNHTLLSHLRLPQPGGPGEVRWGYFTTDGHSVSMSWYRAPLWDLRLDIISCRNVAVWNLRFVSMGGRPLWREDGSAICGVINGPSCSEPETILYCLIWDSPNLDDQVPVFISPQQQGGPVIPPPPGTGSLYGVSYDSPRYGGGILTLPLPGGTGPCISLNCTHIYSSLNRKCGIL